MLLAFGLMCLGTVSAQSSLPATGKADMLQRMPVKSLRPEGARLAAFAADAGRPVTEASKQPHQSATRIAALNEAHAMFAVLAGEMVEVKAGRFRMGDLGGNGQSDERPVHDVAVAAFRLAKYEVTFEQYDLYAMVTGKALPDDRGWGRGNRPVINVNWEDAQGFIAWLNEQSGAKYRLPSEAEWEYAARAGSTTQYPWGDAFDPGRANGSRVDGADQWSNTAPVGSLSANEFGLYDMVGNVWEWTADCWNASYEGAPPDGSAWTVGDCTRRLVRGGSWNLDPPPLRVSNRAGDDSAYRLDSLGFRLAQDP